MKIEQDARSLQANAGHQTLIHGGEESCFITTMCIDTHNITHMHNDKLKNQTLVCAGC